MRAGLCDAVQEEICRAEYSDDGLAWACGKCEKKKTDGLHFYTVKLLKVRALKLAGYPLRANDLTLDEWIDLGRIETWLSETPTKSK